MTSLGKLQLLHSLTVGHLVDLEPLDGGGDEAGHVCVDVVDVVELLGHGVPRVDGEDLPVRLALVDHGERAQQLHRHDLATLVDGLAWVRVKSNQSTNRVEASYVVSIATQVYSRTCA